MEGFKAVYTDIPKTDLKGAWVIADCLRFGRERKHREARHHHHKRSLVLTARNLVRMVYALLSEGQIYVRMRRIS